jgi:hypothetical protein
MRPLPRPFRLVGLALRWLLVVIVVGWLGVRLWALHVVRTALPEFEAKYGSLDPAQWSREPLLSPADNGAFWYRAASLLVERPEAATKVWQPVSHDYSVDGAEPEVEAALDELLRANGPALELARAAARKPRCVLWPSLPAPGGEVPNFLALMHLARLEKALALRDLRGGRPEVATRIEDLLRLGSCLGQEKVAVPALVGDYVEREGLEALRQGLALGALDGGEDRLIAALRSAEGRLSVAEMIRTELAIYRPGSPFWRSPQARGWAPALQTASPIGVPGIYGAMMLRAAPSRLDAIQSETPPPMARASCAIQEDDPTLVEALLGPLAHVGHEHDAGYAWRIDRLLRTQASVRQMAIAALELRSRARAEGSYPTEGSSEWGPATPLLGERVQVEPQADGGFRLSLPATERRWNEIQRLALEPNRLRFDWTLPALEGSAEKGRTATEPRS